MARINIEDSYWADARRMRLAIMLGCQFKADGVMVNVWRLAQEFWCPNRRGIPIPRWEAAGIPSAVIECGLAEVIDGVVFVRGVEERFAWFLSAQESGRIGGQKSAQKRAAPRSSKTKKKVSSDPQATVDGPQATLKRIEPSSSSSSSSSLSSSSSGSSSSCLQVESEKQKTGAAGKGEIATPIALTWRSYNASYERRWGVEATWNGTVAGQVAHFCRRVPAHEAPEIAAFYLTHTDYRYVKAMHPIGMLLQDAEKLRTEWLTNTQMTGVKAMQAEKSGHYQDQLDRIAKGTL